MSLSTAARPKATQDQLDRVLKEDCPSGNLRDASGRISGVWIAYMRHADGVFIELLNRSPDNAFVFLIEDRATSSGDTPEQQALELLRRNPQGRREFLTGLRHFGVHRDQTDVRTGFAIVELQTANIATQGLKSRGLAPPDFKVLFETVRKHVAKVADAFFATLDFRALELIRKTRRPAWFEKWIDAEVYAQLDESCTPGAPLRHAIEKAPYIAQLIVESARSTGFRTFEEPAELIRQAVVAKRKRADTPQLRRAAAAIMDAGSIVVDALDGLPEIRWIRTSYHPVVEAAWILANTPPEWAPKDEPQWRALISLTMTINAMDRVRHGVSMTEFLNCKGDWVGFLSRLHAIAGGHDTPHQAVYDVASDVMDYLAAFRRHVQPILPSPANANGHAHKRCEMALCAGRSLARIFSDSVAWHGQSSRMEARIATITPEVARATCWKPGLPDFAHGNIEIVTLTSKKDLTAEGARGADDSGVAGLNHCVGGYAEPCLSGKSRIISLRRVLSDGLRRRLSTAEIDVSELRPKTFRVLQHRGIANEAPSADAETALKAFMKDLKSGALPVDGDAFQAQELPFPPEVAECGYDYRVPGAWEGAYEAWKSFLVRPMRSWTRGDFYTFVTAETSEEASSMMQDEHPALRPDTSSTQP